MNVVFALAVLLSTNILGQSEVAAPSGSAPAANGSSAVPVVPVKPVIPPAFEPGFFGKPRGPKPSETRGDRYDGSEPDYNTEQLKNWKDECKKELKVGMLEYRKCFNAAKARDLGNLKQQALDVERRQSYPLSNVAPPIQDYEKTPSDENDD